MRANKEQTDSFDNKVLSTGVAEAQDFSHSQSSGQAGRWTGALRQCFDGVSPLHNRREHSDLEE